MSRGEIKMKFCESLDKFVEIRQFSEEESERLFKNVRISDKKAYKRLVINAAIVNYLDEVAPLVFGNNNYSLFGEIAEQELYNLVIKVNPGLDIKKITISLNEGAQGEDAGVVPILEGCPEEEEDVTDRLIRMEEHIHRRLVGQNEAVELVSQSIRKAHVGLRNPGKPIGSFIFAGQTGVGKTELAKALAEFLYGSEHELIRMDCSEFSQSHEYAKLIGAPPGYIGHKEGGVLTESVKNRPKSVVLFDEIEKAHSKVHNVLLQILDDGILTDNHGEKITFKDTLIIMTTNVGAEEFKSLDKTIGFGTEAMKKDHKIKSRITFQSLEKIFPPEFLNRVDEIVTFYALTRDNLLDIADIMINEVGGRLEKLGMSLVMTPKARELLVDKGTDIKFGARPLRRAVKRNIENPLAEAILEKKFEKGDRITATVKKNEIVFTKAVAGDTEKSKKGASQKKGKSKKGDSGKKAGSRKKTAAGRPGRSSGKKSDRV